MTDTLQSRVEKALEPLPKSMFERDHLEDRAKELQAVLREVWETGGPWKKRQPNPKKRRD